MTATKHPADAFTTARDPQAKHKGVLRIVRRFFMAEVVAVITVHFDYNGTTYSETLRVADVELLGDAPAPAAAATVTRYAVKLENADRLTHVVSGFRTLADVQAHLDRTGLRLVSLEAREEPAPAPLENGPTMILDMDVVANGDYHSWEVFNAQTGSVLARGQHKDRAKAELAAAQAITARTLRVQRVTGAWAVVTPEHGAVPLPLTPRATEAQALAHVRALPLALGKQVLAA